MALLDTGAPSASREFYSENDYSFVSCKVALCRLVLVVGLVLVDSNVVFELFIEAGCSALDHTLIQFFKTFLVKSTTNSVYKAFC